ncbi:hypothetical protein [uncultured Jatrophihabitans sp.]|uniref:WXG100-like domain-containing protein n=1 Tax=uncultured Jatrophihabitans sp. TaxID=1610747 RepID=UPI0035CC0AC6
MAGDDPAGTQWAASYDRVAPSAIQAAEDVINACFRVSAMLGATARNYANAELASTPRGHRGDPHIAAAVATLPDDERIGLPTSIPSASAGAGGADLPFGWHFIAHHLGGYVWPNGHQDRLRAAAAAWRASASALEGHVTAATFVDLGPLVDRLPEGSDIATVCMALGDHLHDVATVHRGLARACSELAGHIDHAHSRIEAELRSLVEWTAGIEVAGAVASVFSFGTAEAPTQAGEAARIATTVARVVGILRDFVAAARVVLAEIAPLEGVVAGVRSAVAWLKELRIVEIEVAGVPGLRGYQVMRIERTGSETASTAEVATGEEGAISKLASEANTAGTGVAHWRDPATLGRHFRSHARDFGCSTEADYANEATAFYERGRAEGLPTKIDENGDIRIYDPQTNTFGSYAPDGTTRTFYKPSGGLKYWNRQPGKAP